MIYLNLLLIAVFVALCFESGFWDSIDGYVNKRFKFYHLPHLFRCGLCQTWWLCFTYLLFSSNITLFNLVIAILIAHFTDTIRALFCSIREMVNKLINILNNKIIK